METEKAVYILGAGCSVDCGYPLGSGFLAELEKFGATPATPETERIRKAVITTVALLKQRGIPTIDELVARINNGVFDDKNTPHLETGRARSEKIYDAKVATDALFRSKEPAARRGGLGGYGRFLWKIFPGQGHWTQQLQRAKCHVLTFNYDQLFEMAFLDRFAVDTGQFPLYGQLVLNSGLDVIRKAVISFAPNRFCFLKLHGSVAMSARERPMGGPEHYQNCRGPAFGMHKEPMDKDYYPRLSSPYKGVPEPLIVFPHEKDALRDYPNNLLPYREYIIKVWGQAERVMAEASQVCIIGYSFSPIDRPYLFRLLSKARAGIPVQVKNPEAERICHELTSENPGLPIQFEPLDSKF